MSQTSAEMKALRDSAGRVNWGEYSRMTGTPIQKNAAPTTVKSSSQDEKARSKAKRLGRVTVSEYNALTAKRKRKAVPRKRIASK